MSAILAEVLSASVMLYRTVKNYSRAAVTGVGYVMCLMSRYAQDPRTWLPSHLLVKVSATSYLLSTMLALFFPMAMWR